MSASYPGSAKTFTTKSTNDVIQASHINDLQDEVTAVETALLTGLAHLLLVTGFGAHSITATGTGPHQLTIRNSSAGTTNETALNLGNDSAATAGVLKVFASTFTSAGLELAEGLLLRATRSGGLNLVASDAAGRVRVYSGGSTIRSQWTQAGLFDHNNALSFSGINTPTQLAANTDDWAITDFATGFFFRISSDAGRNLTGIAGGSGGRVIALSNQGAFTITLKHNQTSTAGNRFLLPGATDFLLTTFKTCLAYYDSTAAAWCVIG
jgi:hypothetical protein